MCEISPPPGLTGTMWAATVHHVCFVCAAHCWAVLCAAVCGGTWGLLACECEHLATRVCSCGGFIPTWYMLVRGHTFDLLCLTIFFLVANLNCSHHCSPFSLPSFLFSLPSLPPSLPPSLQFLGNDVLHVYNKQQVKHRLNTGGLYLANTKPGGFCIEISNLLSSTTVMVGVRVQLGCRSLERAPSFIEVFGRTHQVSV